MLLLTCLNMPADKIITQTIFAVQFTSRSFPHLGAPRYSSATNSQLTASSLYRYDTMSNYAFFSKVSSQWQEAFYVTLGASGHLSTATSVPCYLHNSIVALLPHQPKGLGDAEKFHCDITFLLVSTKEGVVGDRMYGLSMVWVNPYQARVSTVEQVVKQLITTVSKWTCLALHLGAAQWGHLPCTTS